MSFCILDMTSVATQSVLNKVHPPYHKRDYNLKGISDITWRVYYFWMRWESHLKAVPILQPPKVIGIHLQSMWHPIVDQSIFMTHEYRLAT